MSILSSIETGNAMPRVSATFFASAPKLQPDFRAKIGAHLTLDAGVRQEPAQLDDALRFFAGRLGERHALTIFVNDDAWGFNFGGLPDDRANRALLEQGQLFCRAIDPALPAARRNEARTRRLYVSLNAKESSMTHVYKVVELVGASTNSIEDAINTALSRASETLRNLRWFEVLQTRGDIENGKTAHFQVTLRVGFTLE
jgi:dodecin